MNNYPDVPAIVAETRVQRDSTHNMVLERCTLGTYNGTNIRNEVNVVAHVYSFLYMKLI